MRSSSHLISQPKWLLLLLLCCWFYWVAACLLMPVLGFSASAAAAGCPLQLLLLLVPFRSAAAVVVWHCWLVRTMQKHFQYGLHGLLPTPLLLHDACSMSTFAAAATVVETGCVETYYEEVRARRRGYIFGKRQRADSNGQQGTSKSNPKVLRDRCRSNMINISGPPVTTEHQIKTIQLHFYDTFVGSACIRDGVSACVCCPCRPANDWVTAYAAVLDTRVTSRYELLA